MFFEQRIADDANIETADAHVETKQKEIAMIVMPDAVVQPRWFMQCQGKVSRYIFTLSTLTAIFQMDLG